MTEPKIHISRAIWDEDTHEVAYIVDGVMLADVATQRKLNAVDDMYEALLDCCGECVDTFESDSACRVCSVGHALRKARGEEK